MNVDVLVHLEPVEDDQHFAWWAETSQFPHFSAAAPHLPELLQRVRAAIPDVARENEMTEELEITFRLASEDGASGGYASEEHHLLSVVVGVPAPA